MSWLLCFNFAFLVYFLKLQAEVARENDSAAALTTTTKSAGVNCKYLKGLPSGTGLVKLFQVGWHLVLIWFLNVVLDN